MEDKRCKSHGNAAQMQAITHGNGPAMVLAGPGSGKTFVIAERIKALIELKNVDPGGILTITFTRKAAAQMRQRFLRISEGRYPQVTFGTFHSIFYQILRLSETDQINGTPKLITEQQKFKIVSMLFEDAKKSDSSLNVSADTIRTCMAEIGRLKGQGLDENSASDKLPFSAVFPQIFQRYNRILGEFGLIDFDDMIIRCLDLMRRDESVLKRWQERFTHILIDEYQDINSSQSEAVELIAGPQNNLFVVGDDDQSIYGFRGSRPDFMLDFAEKHPGAVTIYLDVNYRSVQEIIDASEAVIGENKSRFEKHSRSGVKQEAEGETGSGDMSGGAGKTGSTGMSDDTGKIGSTGMSGGIEKTGSASVSGVAGFASAVHPVALHSFVGEKDELDAMATFWSKEADISRCAVIVRTNALAEHIAGELILRGVPAYHDGGIKDPYSHKEIEDVFAYLRLCGKKPERADLFRVMNKPFRYLSRECARGSFRSIDDISFWYSGRSAMKKNADSFVRDIKMLSGMRPALAIRYIRGKIGYDRFVETSGEWSDPGDVMKRLDSLTEEAREYDGTAAFLRAIEQKREMFNSSGMSRASSGSMSGVSRSSETSQGRIIPIQENSGVQIITMHASKGLEYDSVWLPGLNEGTIPSKKIVQSEQFEEERRLLYVAMTRARRKLVMSYITGSESGVYAPSRYLGPVRKLLGE